MMKNLLARMFLLLLFSLTVSVAHAQNPTEDTLDYKPSPDEQLAAQYYQAGEFDKAVVYYEKLYDKNPISIYYNYYLNCLINTKSFRKAEKVVTKQSKRYPNDLRYKVDMGRVRRAEGDEAKAKKEFDAAIGAIGKFTSANAVIDLANAFLGLNETDFAIQALQKGRRELSGSYTFALELAEVYALKRDYEAMIKEYLDLLEQADYFKQQVQNELQAKLDADAEDKIAPLLKADLLRRSQKNPNQLIWNELLMWLFLQQKDFNAAFTQAKAIDKRQKLEGKEVMELASTVLANKDYDVALACYDYVISLGKESTYYRKASMARVNAHYEQVINSVSYTQPDLLEVEKEMETTLTELGRDSRTVPLMLSLAHLQAFYLFNTKKAITVLEEAIAIPQISPYEQAQCKVELGDVMLLDGQVWEASLFYSQVEKAFKREPIGQEAKYRNAKIAFYIGDFEWAQTQLNVLKGATSKLISNDAMYLSILITDNLALDSISEPLELFAEADLMLFQNNYKMASQALDSIDILFPKHSLADDVLFMRYRMAYKQQRWVEAAGFLQQIVDTYGWDVLGDDATFRLAELYDYKLGDTKKAMALYQDVLVKFPGSLFTVEARKRFRALRGDKPDKEQ
jgi:tetratricopeptide (TPR) repeat protein